MDTQQCQYTASLIQELVRCYLLEQDRILTEHALESAYRCSKRVAQLTNRVLSLEDTLSPKRKQLTYTSVQSALDVEGEVSLIANHQEHAATLRKQCADADTVVISLMPNKDRSAIKESWATEHVITPMQTIEQTSNLSEDPELQNKLYASKYFFPCEAELLDFSFFCEIQAIFCCLSDSNLT